VFLLCFFLRLKLWSNFQRMRRFIAK
jgi:hypothetical protein